MTIIDEWNAKTGEEQLNFCRACVVKAASQEYGIKALFQNGNEIDDYVNTVYIKLMDTLTPEHIAKINQERRINGKSQITLQSMIYRAARAVLAREIRRNRQDEARNGGEVDTMNEQYATPHDLTDNLILTVNLEMFTASRDTTDQRIIELVAEGFTEREIAAEIGISNVAVHKRIVKIRGELIKAIA